MFKDSFMLNFPFQKFSHVTNSSCNCCECGCKRTRKKGACVWSLSTLKISIGSRDAIFPSWNFVFVHTKTSRATRLPQLKTCRLKHFIYSFFYRLFFHLLTSRHNPNLNVIGFSFSSHERSNHSQ